MQLVVHDLTRQRLDELSVTPPHALIIAGPGGIGKDTVSRHLIARLLATEPDKLANNARLLVVQPPEGEAFGIDQSRQAQHFMMLRGRPSDNAVSRIAYLPDAHTMTREAQNALLKLLEEPPAGSMLILGTTSELALLPTIVSRSQVLAIQKPDVAQLTDALQAAGHDRSAIDLALRISGGLPGLTVALLENEQHALTVATGDARNLLSQTAFERLAQVDRLAKQRQLSLDICYILQQMAHLALQTSTAGTGKRWQRVLEAAYACHEALDQRANAKLALTQLMLAL